MDTVKKPHSGANIFLRSSHRKCLHAENFELSAILLIFPRQKGKVEVVMKRCKSAYGEKRNRGQSLWMNYLWTNSRTPIFISSKDSNSFSGQPPFWLWHLILNYLNSWYQIHTNFLTATIFTTPFTKVSDKKTSWPFFVFLLFLAFWRKIWSVHNFSYLKCWHWWVLHVIFKYGQWSGLQKCRYWIVIYLSCVKCKNQPCFMFMEILIRTPVLMINYR